MQVLCTMDKVYHYTSSANAIKILSSQQFRFGHLEHSNDPFENLSKRYELSFNIQEPLKMFMNEIFNYANTQLSYASFGAVKGEVLPDQNWTMWAHYANNHTGVCLTFKLDEFFNELDKLQIPYLHDKINYTNALLIPPDFFENRITSLPSEILKEFDKALLFSKHKGWETENEYRIVVFKREFSIPIKNSLIQVLLGPEIKKRNKSRIENILKRSAFKGPFGKLHYSSATYAKPLIFIFQELKENSGSYKKI